MIENIEGVFNEYWKEKIREGSMRGRNQRAKSGHIVCQGLPPYGYQKIGKGKEALYVINPEEARIIKHIFEFYTSGNGSDNPLTLRAMARYLNKAGIHKSLNNRYAEKWSPFTLRWMITNEIYIGRTYYGKTRMVDGVRVIQPLDKRIPIEVPELAIVDKQVFVIANERVKHNKELARYNLKSEYLLIGFLRCGCGAAASGHNRLYHSGNSGKVYLCGRSWSKYTALGKCAQKSWNIVAHKVDEAVWYWIKWVLCDSEVIQKRLQQIVEDRINEVNAKKKQLSLINGLMEEEQRKIKRLVNEIGKLDDSLVVDILRQEIMTATKKYKTLNAEQVIFTDELTQSDLPNAQQAEVLEFIEKIRSRLEDGGFKENLQIMDILNLKAVMHYDETGKWVEVSCSIPTSVSVLVFSPQIVRL
jgi:site-specific DNA recombinase